MSIASGYGNPQERIKQLEAQLAKEKAARERAEDRITRLQRGNTALLEALMQMVDQFFLYDEGKEDVLFHRHMSAEEDAIYVLINAGMAEEVSGSSYRLLWDELRKREAALAQPTDPIKMAQSADNRFAPSHEFRPDATSSTQPAEGASYE